MNYFEIYDADASGALNFDLKELLFQLPTEGLFDFWRLTTLEARGRNVLAIETQVENSRDGLVLNWAELLSFAETLEQVINLRLTGVTPLGKAAKDEKPRLTIGVFDSTFWFLETNLKTVTSWLGRTFVDVRPVSGPILDS